MWLSRGTALRLPRRSGLGDRLERAGLVLAPHLQTQRLAHGVGVLDHFFFDSVSGSVTVTTYRCHY
ncbi:hypothetical protein FRUB_05343 [Fimbriiglobus ruber]|uniref:Uncharacterized protein n=1 Tax=Fimbriiglobus ruber TaxID=1908690 RepID=A0A225DLC9_9BACT|nr:hypothetical protein FRUB_05343 [Fimbriiglobus ruber]